MAIASAARYAPTATAKSKEEKQARSEKEEEEGTGGGEEKRERVMGGERGGPGGTGVCGLARNVVVLEKCKWVGRREKVVLGERLDKSVVSVAVDSKVDQELVMR